MSRIAYFFLFLSLLSQTAFAAKQPVSLTSDEILISAFNVFKDVTETLSIEEVRSGDFTHKFQPNNPDSLLRKRGKEVFWVQMDLVNASGRDGDWVVNFGLWARVDLYIEQGQNNENSQRFLHQQTGSFLPFRERNYQKGDFNALVIPLEEGESVSCWVRLDNRNNFDTPPGPILFQASPQKLFEAAEAQTRAVLFLFIGIYLALFFYNLFVFVATREKTYVYYLGAMLGYVILTLGNSGYLFSILGGWTHLPESRALYLSIVVVLLCISLLMFVRSFLDLKSRYPIWNKVFLGAIVATIIAPLVKIVDYGSGLLLADLVAFSMLIIIMVVCVKATLQKVKGAPYLLLAQIFIVVGSVITILVAEGLIPLNNFTGFYGMALGIALEMILFSFALGNKINTLRKENEKNQEQIIRQLEENTKLQTKVNRELEEKVEERTQEILKQKELVQATQVALDLEISERKIQQAVMEKEKAEASEKMKKQFFAQMTHEFRTPLTLILGPMEEIAEESMDGRVKRKAKLALRNTKILLRLINQLLGLSRLEEGREELHPQTRDIVNFVSQRGAAFESLWQRKNLELEIRKDVEDLYMDFDPDMMEKILNNLMSNAIKFTPEGGKVSLRIGPVKDAPDRVRLTIKDSGIGIPEEKLPFIFDRFYRVDGEKTTELEGTGLGLPLVKELVGLHGGEIRVASLEGLGTEFTLIFPRVQEGKKWEPTPEKPRALSQELEQEAIPLPNKAAQELEQEAIPLPNKAAEDWDLDENRENLLLLIEDNPDVRDYVRMALEPMYKVIEAVNGLDGIQVATQEVPDLIISDVMMPGANGFQVCEAIKKDEKTSHIPIIMLTARAALDDKIEGLETGADAYLSKPFNARELRVQIKNLIENRQNLRERYRKEMITTPTVTEATSIEEQFLIRLKELMQAELSNEKLSVEDMAEQLAMSRTQLHRKVKALTGQSTGEFIRNYRLEYAYQLLEQNAGSVSEVAFQVGFSSASYFSKAFSAKYGMSPKEVRT